MINMKYENMSSLVYEWRKIAKMSQAELAERLGYGSSQFISNVERGLCTFPIKKMRKLSKILRLSPELLVSAYVADTTEELRREVLRTAR